jgi:hypothetical protein
MMINPYPPTAAALDASGAVGIDLPCRKCGYNLRSLGGSGRCPECGSAVGLSVQGDFLRYSDPSWVFGLRRGVNFIIGAIAVIILGLIATIPVRINNRALGEDLTLLVNFVGAVMSLFGGWLLTEPDPSGLGEDQYGAARKLIRICLVIGIFNQVMNVLRDTLAPPPPVLMLLGLVLFAAAICGLIGQFAQLHYLEKLALRIPDDKLSARAHFLKFAIAIAYGALLVFGAATGLAAYTRSNVTFIFGCPTALAGLSLIVFGIMYLLMLERMGKRFKVEAESAQQSWAKIDFGVPEAGSPIGRTIQ